MKKVTTTQFKYVGICELIHVDTRGMALIQVAKEFASERFHTGGCVHRGVQGQPNRCCWVGVESLTYVEE